MSPPNRSSPPTRTIDQVEVTRWDPAWCVDVGVAEHDWETAARLLEVPIPGAAETTPPVQVRLHRDGTWWSLPWERERRVVPWTERSLRWGHETVGFFATAFVVRSPSAIESAEHAAELLDTEGAGTPVRDRVLRTCLVLADELAAGAWAANLERAARVFEEAGDDPEAERWVAAVLRLRLALEDIARSCQDPRLIDVLARADSRLRSSAGAVLLLDEKEYSAIARGRELDLEAWWGVREMLRTRVPVGMLEHALREEAGTAESAPRVAALSVAAVAPPGPARRSRPFWSVVYAATAGFALAAGVFGAAWMRQDRSAEEKRELLEQRAFERSREIEGLRRELREKDKEVESLADGLAAARDEAVRARLEAELRDARRQQQSGRADLQGGVRGVKTAGGAPGPEDAGVDQTAAASVSHPRPGRVPAPRPACTCAPGDPLCSCF